ncbi:MAG: hypothetical protein IT292_00295 [Deltaproteobacteria bacterium]|nr:hypothetical protein [Deltaproteobacteria bacterium]
MNKTVITKKLNIYDTLLKLSRSRAVNITFIIRQVAKEIKALKAVIKQLSGQILTLNAIINGEDKANLITQDIKLQYSLVNVRRQKLLVMHKEKLDLLKKHYDQQLIELKKEKVIQASILNKKRNIKKLILQMYENIELNELEDRHASLR